MLGHELLNVHKESCLVDGNIFATDCILANPDSSLIQGLGATLAPDSPDYNEEDSLKCMGNFIGLTISTETGLGVFGDSVEATLNIGKITIGEPKKGWKINIFLPAMKQWQSFKVENVAIDRITGLYLCTLSLITDKKASGSVNEMLEGLK